MTTGRINQIAILLSLPPWPGRNRSETEGALLVRTLGVVGSRNKETNETALKKGLPPLTPRAPFPCGMGLDAVAVAFVLLAFHQRWPHTKDRTATLALIKGEPARTTLPRQHYSAECTATFARVLFKKTGSQCGLSLRTGLGFNAIHRITTQISLTTSD